MAQKPRRNTDAGQPPYHDKTSYGIMPTPPSPSNPTSPASMTQSGSNSSSSPPLPRTPPPRMRSRYSDLGRVPLHRRGTSGTYERLEDLLKEMGYKETRVFTPESDRIERTDRSSIAGGVGAVVGFLSGFLPSATKGSSQLRPQQDDDHDTSSDTAHAQASLQDTVRELSTSSSPLAYKAPDSLLSPRLLHPSSPSSLAATGPSPNAKYGSPSRTRSSTTPVPNSPSYNASRHPLPSSSSYTSLNSQPPIMQKRNSFQSQQQQRETSQARSKRYSGQSFNGSKHVPLSPNPPPSKTGGDRSPALSAQPQPLFHPHPSRASAYLRHMASTPNIPHRPASTPPSSALIDESLPYDPYVRHGNGEGEEEPTPPLPKTWLENVTKAVMFGGTGAFMGGPARSSSQSRGNKPATLPTPAERHVRSVISKSQLNLQAPEADPVDQYSLKPPSATLYSNPKLQRTRSGLSDRTNISRGRTTLSSARSVSNTQNLAPPTLMTRVGRSRSRKSASEISTTRVVCRSAPGSRAPSSSSRIASPLEAGASGVQRRASTKEKGTTKKSAQEKRTNRRSCSREDKIDLPSLARTRVEGEVFLWSDSRVRTNRSVTEPHSGQHDHGNSSSQKKDALYSDAESGDESNTPNEETSEDDGELDLAQMLVPAKRQQSIKSLRKHLGPPTAQSSLAAALAGSRPPPTLPPYVTAYGSGNSRTFRQWIRRARVTEESTYDPSVESCQRDRSREAEDDDTTSSFIDFVNAKRSNQRREVALPSIWTGHS